MESNFLHLLKPQNVFQTKKRIGPPEDGGYVMTEFVMENCAALFTYGVGYDTRYEEQFSRDYNKPVYLFDHTINGEPWQRDNLTYRPEGLGYAENCKEWFDHYNELGINGDILLKIDIEGYEYEYFSKTDMEKINSNVMGMILEVHWIDNGDNRNNFISIMNKMSEHFVLSHIHGNVWGDVWDFEGHSIPKVFELSFVNKKVITQYEPDNQSYPIEGLDISNNPSKEDCKLDFLNAI
jgi:hypothetical protein